MFANIAIKKHPIAAPRQVDVTRAPAGIPVSDNILGLTAIMYAIVKNVVNPAIISVFLSISLFVNIGNNFCMNVPFWFIK